MRFQQEIRAILESPQLVTQDDPKDEIQLEFDTLNPNEVSFRSGIRGLNVKVHKLNGNKKTNFFIYNSRNEVVCFVGVHRVRVDGDSGIMISDMWQDENHKSLFHDFFLERLLPEYWVILSDYRLTVLGYKFYEKLSREIPVEVIDIKENTVVCDSSDSKRFREYFGVGDEYRNFMYMVKKS